MRLPVQAHPPGDVGGSEQTHEYERQLEGPSPAGRHHHPRELHKIDPLHRPDTDKPVRHDGGLRCWDQLRSDRKHICDVSSEDASDQQADAEPRELTVAGELSFEELPQCRPFGRGAGAQLLHYSLTRLR